MPANKLAIKTRIRSIDSTMKITKAMQLVAASKYQRQKERMRKNKEYATELKNILEQILSTIHSDHPYLKANDSKKECYVVFTSDMGMCGGYNMNVLKHLESVAKPEDRIYMIGQRGVTWLKYHPYADSLAHVQVEDDNYAYIAMLADEILQAYLNQEISKIHVLYTVFVNPLVFTPKAVTLLPVEPKEVENGNIDTIFEPSDEKILNSLIPMAVKSLMYSYYLESKTSEQASRRTSMENATDNAEELKEKLELEYNQARQAAITQEISEIVGGANAL